MIRRHLRHSYVILFYIFFIFLLRFHHQMWVGIQIKYPIKFCIFYNFMCADLCVRTFFSGRRKYYSKNMLTNTHMSRRCELLLRDFPTEFWTQSEKKESEKSFNGVLCKLIFFKWKVSCFGRRGYSTAFVIAREWITMGGNFSGKFNFSFSELRFCNQKSNDSLWLCKINYLWVFW